MSGATAGTRERARKLAKVPACEIERACVRFLLHNPNRLPRQAENLQQEFLQRLHNSRIRGLMQPVLAAIFVDREALESMMLVQRAIQSK